MYREQILNEEHLDVLRNLRKFLMPDAIIAGGAIRDYVMGKPFKDVDIWFNAHNPKLNLQQSFEILLPKLLKFDAKNDFVDVPRNFNWDILNELDGGLPPRRRAANRIFGNRHGLYFGIDDPVAPENVAPESPAQEGAGVTLSTTNNPLEWLTVTSSPAYAITTDSADIQQESREVTAARIFDDAAKQIEESPYPVFLYKNPKRRINYSLSFYYRGSQYQLMNINVSPQEFVEKEFDMGFCKIMHDGEKLIRTKAFDYDLEHKFFTINGKRLGAANFKWSTTKHLPRLKLLYPDFKENIVSVPEEEKKPALKKRPKELDYPHGYVAPNGNWWDDEIKMWITPPRAQR